MLDPEKIAGLVVATIKASLVNVTERLTAIETRLATVRDGEKGEKGDPGQPGAVGEIGPMGLTGPKGDPGQDADPALLKSLETVLESLKAEILEGRQAFAEFKASSDARIEAMALEVKTMVAANVAEAVSGLPAPKDGTSVTVQDVAPLVLAEVQKAVAALPAAKDGVGLTGALIDRAGNLVVTLSDGSTKDVGPVVGRDVDPVAVKAWIEAEVAKIPRPQDGKDGLNGFGFDDMQPAFDEAGHLLLRFVRGDQVKDVPVPGFVDRGVYRADTGYIKGDGATFGGSFWIAQKDGPGKPGEPESGWRLAVKKGADGKQGDKGQDGKHGRDGKDLTQLGPRPW